MQSNNKNLIELSETNQAEGEVTDDKSVTFFLLLHRAEILRLIIFFILVLVILLLGRISNVCLGCLENNLELKFATLLAFALIFSYCLFPFRLCKSRVTIVPAGQPLPIVEKQINNGTIHLAIRALHPSHYPSTTGDGNVLHWLHKRKQDSLRAKILFTLTRLTFSSDGYLDKLRIALLLHSPQLLGYIGLLLIASIGHQFPKLPILEFVDKFDFYFVGLFWLLWTIWLYRKQVTALDESLREMHQNGLSTSVPLYIWNKQTLEWEEKTDVFATTGIKDYGLDAEKAFTFANGVLLALLWTIMRGL